MPLPEQPSALFVGVLERYKNVDGLAEAWRRSRRASAGRAAADRRRRLAARASSSRWACAGTATSSPTEVAARARRRRPCSCSRRARRGWAACWSRRSAAGAGSSRRGSAGSRDLVADGESGLLVEPRLDRRRSPTRSCECSPTPSWRRGSAGARGRSVERLAPDAGAVRRADPRARRGAMKPPGALRRPTRYSLPLSPGLARKWEAIGGRIDYRVLGCAEWDGGSGDERFELLRPIRPRRLDGARVLRAAPVPGRAHAAATPAAGGRRREPADRRTPSSSAARSRDGRARSSWSRCTATGATRHACTARRRGSSSRRSRTRSRAGRSAVPTRCARSRRTPPAWSRRRPAARPRARSPRSRTSRRSPSGRRCRSPSAPSALFVGVLEAAQGRRDARRLAWGRGSRRAPRRRRPGLAGAGRRAGSASSIVGEVLAGGGRRALDAATVLVLPSLHEGLGRVIIESFARGRGVVASAAGGIADLVADGVEGLLVDPETRRRSPRRSSASSRTGRSPSGSARPRARASTTLGISLESYADQLAALGHLDSRRASRPRKAAAQERPLPDDRRDRDDDRRRRRRRRPRASRAHVPQGQRPSREPDHGADRPVRRADGGAPRARLPGRLARRRARPLRAGSRRCRRARC